VFVAVIPEGPLHPDDAVLGLVVGVTVGVLVRAVGRHGAVLVFVGAIGVFESVYPGTAIGSIEGRWIPLVASLVVAVVSAAAAASGQPTRSSRAVLVSLVPAIALTWGLVPDTEAAVIGGAVVVGALLAGSAVWDRRSLIAVASIPAFAALVGSVGRPGRLWPALAAIVGAACLSVVADRLRSQRAGTPTTVVPGATSEVTTAPAPTTAP